MNGGLGSCLTRVGCLTLLVLGVAGGWWYREDVARWWAARSAARVAPVTSEELATRTADRLERLLRSPAGGELRLGETEVASYVRHRVVPRLPPGVADPRVRLRDSTAVVEASVDLVRLTGDGLPDALRNVLGDSTRITATLAPSVPEPGRLRLRIRDLQAGALSVPSMMLPFVLRETRLPVSRTDPSSLEVPVGRGLTGARVEGGVLVLVRAGDAGR